MTEMYSGTGPGGWPWVHGLRRRNLILLCMVLGALAALGQAPLGLWPATVLAFAAIYGIWSQGWPTRRSALIGWAAGTGYFLISLSWIVEPFLVDVARYGWMAPFAVFFLSGGLALFWGLSFGVAARIAPNAAGWITAFVLTEALRGVVFTGFPWAQPGHVLIGTPMMQWAGFAGALVLTLAVLAGAVALWHLLRGQRIMGGLSLAVLAGAYVAGGSLNPVEDVPEDAKIVRLVQPNAPQDEKWDPEKIGMFYRRQLDFTGAGAVPDLVVWPESSFPLWLNDAEEALRRVANRARGAYVALGIQRYEGERNFNSLALIGPGGDVSALYDKQHLVPFGEYLPFGSVLKRFGLRGLAAEDGAGFSAGPGPKLIDVPGMGRALPLICYEGVFPGDVAAAPERPDFMLLITNDAWFGEVSGPYQHLAQARLRSVEQGVPMIRVANTGISAMIDARGDITGSLPLGEAGWLDLPMPPKRAETLYSKTADWPILAVMLLGLGFGSFRRRSL